MAIRSSPKDKDRIDVLDYIETILREKYDVRPQRGREWLRFPAVWRNSMDYNIAANANGTVFDHTQRRQISLDELMTLLGEAPDPSRLGRSFQTRDEIENSNAAKLRRTRSKWNDGIALNQACPATEYAIRYLLGRGIPEAVVERIKPFVRASMSEGPMLLTPMYSPVDASLLGLQRYYIDEEGQKRIPEWNIPENGKITQVKGEKPKMMMGFAQHGGFACGVIIHGDRERYTERKVAACEGYETGLAIHAATGMPVYVLYTAGGLERLHLPYLSSLGVEGLIICGDNDLPDAKGIRRGQQASGVLAERVIAECDLMPQVAMPQEAGEDWRDVFQRDPALVADSILNAPAYDMINLIDDEPEASAVTLGPLLARRYHKKP